MEKRKEFYICCLLFCFKTQPLNITAKLPATGFTAGQLIDLTLVADNQSSKTVKNFKVEFFKVKSKMNASRQLNHSLLFFLRLFFTPNRLSFTNQINWVRSEKPKKFDWLNSRPAVATKARRWNTQLVLLCRRCHQPIWPPVQCVAWNTKYWWAH